MLVDPVVAPLDEGADGGGRGVEDAYLVVVDELPEAVVLREVGRALIHHDGGAVLQRAVDDVAVAGDPADVRRTPVDVVLLQVKDVLAGEVGLDGVAAGGVDQAFGLPCGAAGVEDEERSFGVHRAGRTDGRGGDHQVMPPEVATGGERDLHVRNAGIGGVLALVDDDAADAGTALDGLVDDLLELDGLAAAVADVLREDDAAVGVVDAVGDGVGREAAEDDRVHRADACAGEHRDGELRAHAHVNGDAVALLDSERLEDVGELLYLFEELGVGELADFGLSFEDGFALPEQGDLVRAVAVSVAVDAVVREVELAAGEPFGVGAGAVEHFFPGSEPVEFGSGLGPETFRVIDGAAVHLLVLLERADVGAGGEVGGRREDAVLAKQGLEGFSSRGSGRHGFPQSPEQLRCRDGVPMRLELWKGSQNRRKPHVTLSGDDKQLEIVQGRERDMMKA